MQCINRDPPPKPLALKVVNLPIIQKAFMLIFMVHLKCLIDLFGQDVLKDKWKFSLWPINSHPEKEKRWPRVYVVSVNAYPNHVFRYSLPASVVVKILKSSLYFIYIFSSYSLYFKELFANTRTSDLGIENINKYFLTIITICTC